MIQVYKILNNIDNVDEDSLFTMSAYPSIRGHSQKLFKRRHGLRIRQHFFSNRTVDSWNDLPADVVNPPCLNSFKSRLNKC